MADYKTIRGTATFEYEEKRSRFIATASFADTEEKALAVLNAVRAANRTARHNVYAYVLQNGRTRYSDDGEPAKTAGTPVLALTATERALLQRLADDRGHIVTYDAVCEAVWGADYYGYENSLNVHIRHLREKIEPDPGHPQWLLTVRGIGYRLTGEV